MDETRGDTPIRSGGGGLRPRRRAARRRELWAALSATLAALAFAPAALAQDAYVVGDQAPNISVIDTATNTVIATVPVSSPPRAIAIAPARPAPTIAPLIDTVNGQTEVTPDSKKSLLSKLHDASAALDAGDTARACDILQALVNAASAQLDKKKLTEDQAYTVIEDATAIRATLGCS